MTTDTPVHHAPDAFADTAIVMITRNEEGAVAKVVDDARQHAPGAEIIVVDGSSDRTPEVAREHGAVVVAEPGGGPASALVAALQASDRPIIVTVDADDTYPAPLIPALVELVRGGFDVAGTDRLAGGRPATMPFANYVANVGFNVLASARALRRIRDVHTGMRAYRREVVHTFEWDTEGLALPVDLIVWPARAGYRFTEIPIEYRERVGETTLVRWPGTTWTIKRIVRPGRPARTRAETDTDQSKSGQTENGMSQ